MKKVVIVGGVAGGASCAARLRRLDENCEIVLLERGKHISYANCGLPYHIGNVIKSGRALLVQTPELMRARYGIDVRVENEVTSIDPSSHSLRVADHSAGREYTEGYDTLVLATGSSPLRPPIPGIDSPRVCTLWTVDDALRIRKLMRSAPVRSAVVVGGGFIGLEVAENLRLEGFDVTVVELQKQVFLPFDEEMALVLQSYMREHGIAFRLGEGVSSFSETEDGVDVRLQSGETLRCGLVVFSAGIRPNSALAAKAGLRINAQHGIEVDKYLRTSDPDIYALGDVIVGNRFGEKLTAPLAGPANRQGRIAADNIAGGSVAYDGAQGSSVIQMFEYTVAATGLNERALRGAGLLRGRDYESVLIAQNHHASFYPGAEHMFIKLLFTRDGECILGAQIAGGAGVDKRIDAIATAMALGAGVRELEALDFAYSPPYSAAKDPVNMAGFTAANLLDGRLLLAGWDEPAADPEAVLMDIREAAEKQGREVENALSIPLGRLRERLDELDRERKYILLCAVGSRAYTAARAMMQRGFREVKVYPGGAAFLHRVAEGDTLPGIGV